MAASFTSLFTSFRLAGFTGSVPLWQCHGCTFQRRGRFWPINTLLQLPRVKAWCLLRKRTCTVWFFAWAWQLTLHPAERGAYGGFPAAPGPGGNHFLSVTGPLRTYFLSQKVLLPLYRGVHMVLFPVYWGNQRALLPVHRRTSRVLLFLIGGTQRAVPPDSTGTCKAKDWSPLASEERRKLKEYLQKQQTQTPSVSCNSTNNSMWPKKAQTILLKQTSQTIWTLQKLLPHRPYSLSRTHVRM